MYIISLGPIHPLPRILPRELASMLLPSRFCLHFCDYAIDKFAPPEAKLHLIMSSWNSGYRINRNRQSAATEQLGSALGSLQMAVGGKCLYFLKGWRWVWCAALDAFFHPATPNRAVCHRLPGHSIATCPRASVGMGASSRSHLWHSV